MSIAVDLDAQSAYDSLADAYDALTADYDHDRWLEAIEALAIGHGLSGRRVLDVACGTGKSFLPLLARGYAITACDLSPRMLARAAGKVRGRAELHLADMRALPLFGAFDLVTCLDDAVNYLLEEDDVVAALEGMRANLPQGGLLVFDVNTLATYRSTFASDWALDAGDHLTVWRGRAAPDLEPGECVEALVDIFATDGGGWRREPTRHRQRHWPVPVLVELLDAAGLAVAGLWGQLPGARLEPEVDEGRHAKALVIAVAS